MTTLENQHLLTIGIGCGAIFVVLLLAIWCLKAVRKSICLKRREPDLERQDFSQFGRETICSLPPKVFGKNAKVGFM